MISTTRRLGVFLRVLRIRAGLDQAQMARHLGVTQPTISRWEHGGTRPDARFLQGWLKVCTGSVSAEQLQAFSRLLDRADTEWTDGSHVARELEQLTAELLNQGRLVSDALIPLYADVAAGIGEAQEQLSEPRCTLAIPRDIYRRDPQCYALRVSGDSMAPQLLDGDTVVVSPAAPLVDGCIVAAFVEPDGDVIKVYRELPGGTVLLQPANSSYRSILLAPNGGREARIWGRVVLQQREL